jgi:acyl carrier protein
MAVTTLERSTEAVVLEIVRDVLGDAGVRLDDDLFELGYDSLRIARTAARVRERLDVDLPLSVYFDAATVAELAGTVDAARR